MVHFLQLSLAECVPCLGVMGTMYLEDVMPEYGSSVSSLTTGSTAITYELILDVPKLLFALL